jgi:hypothetical protein
MARSHTRKKRRIRKVHRGGNNSEAKVYIFYHVYCNKYTMPILKDQATRIIFSGLYEAVTSIKCFLAGDLKADIDAAEAYLKDCGEKFTI